MIRAMNAPQTDSGVGAQAQSPMVGCSPSSVGAAVAPCSPSSVGIAVAPCSPSSVGTAVAPEDDVPDDKH
eukprot:4471548-Prymnesium_polylepis.1